MSEPCTLCGLPREHPVIALCAACAKDAAEEIKAAREAEKTDSEETKV